MPILDIPQAVNVVTNEVIVEQNAHTLDEVLANISNVTPANTLGGTQDAFIRRGFGDNRDGSVLTNGMRTVLPNSFNATADRVEVLKGATGRDLADYMAEKLWSPLGAECDGQWLTDNDGAEIAFGGLNLCLRDYARFGLLYLHEGRNLAGEQIVPRQWVQQSVTPAKDFLRPGRYKEQGQPNLGYGYQWWTYADGSYSARGIFGQGIFIDPKRKLVVALN
eukprot:gene10665-13055_t